MRQHELQVVSLLLHDTRLPDIFLSVDPGICIYSVHPFTNNVAVALKNAKKRCDDKGCEHWHWEGGESLLINAENKVLVHNWPHDYQCINWYSLRVDDKNVDTTLFESYPGADGHTYSFLNYEKEFEKWFYTVFVKTLSNRDSFKKNVFPVVTFSLQNEKGWVHATSTSFIRSCGPVVKMQLSDCNKNNTNIFSEDLNDMLYTDKQYSRFRDPGGVHEIARYPIFEVIKSYCVGGKDKQVEQQSCFEFIRTEKGYRLHSVSIP